MPLTQVQGQMLSGSNNTTTTIQSNGTTAITIDSSQNVGIGTSSPSCRLDLGSGTGTQTAIKLTDQWQDIVTSSHVVGTRYNYGSGTYYGRLYSNATGFNLDTGTNAVNMVFGTNNTERMRITSGGSLLVGGTSPDGRFVTTSGENNPTGRFYSTLSTFTSEAFQVICAKSSNTNFNVAAFYINNAAQYAAYIRGDGTIFAQNTTVQSASDVRFKENIVDSNDGLNVINELRPVRFDLKEGNGVTGKQNQLGFIAQEVKSIFPDAVDVWGESDDPESPYLSLGTGSLIPVLVKAIQEQQAMIEELKVEVQALKAK